MTTFAPAPTETSHHPAAFDSLVGLGHRRVLLIEDDADITTGWTLLLRHRGLDVAIADRGDHGLELALQEEPDLVVLDLGLPGMHGLKVLHELRMQQLPSKVLVVTAQGTDAIARRALQTGAALVLQKPVEPETMLQAIAELLDG